MDAVSVIITMVRYALLIYFCWFLFSSILFWHLTKSTAITFEIQAIQIHFSLWQKHLSPFILLSVCAIRVWHVDFNTKSFVCLLLLCSVLFLYFKALFNERRKKNCSITSRKIILKRLLFFLPLHRNVYVIAPQNNQITYLWEKKSTEEKEKINHSESFVIL